jgi:hypothetical protein
MTLSIPALLWCYVTLFLAVVFGAWLAFILHRQKCRQGWHKVHACPHCGKKIRVKGEMIFTRCPHCDAKLRLDELFEKNRY